MEKTFWLKSEDQTNIYIKKWYSGNAKPKAIIQLSHGMVEHIGRYESFAKYLVNKGFIVYGNDHRGHGQTGLEQGMLGYFAERHGFEKVMEDLHQVTKKIKQEHPEVPIILFGHSMGSFLARYYLQKYSKSVNGVILSGTGFFPVVMTNTAKLIASLLPAKKQSEFMNNLAFGNYNKKIKLTNTKFDWLTRDVNEIRKYIEDPLCGFVPTAQFFVDLMTGFNLIQHNNNLIRKDLPMLFISGSADPVGDYEKGVWKSVYLYKQAGIENIITFLFEKARHELLNEINKEDVYEVTYKWIHQQLDF